MQLDKTQVNDFKDFTEMVGAHRGVLKSLIDKDGYYKSSEAGEIHNGFGKQLSYMKLMIEVYKLMGIKPTKKDLFLPEDKEDK